MAKKQRKEKVNIEALNCIYKAQELAAATIELKEVTSEKQYSSSFSDLLKFKKIVMTRIVLYSASAFSKAEYKTTSEVLCNKGEIFHPYAGKKFIDSATWDEWHANLNTTTYKYEEACESYLVIDDGFKVLQEASSTPSEDGGYYLNGVSLLQKGYSVQYVPHQYVETKKPILANFRTDEEAREWILSNPPVVEETVFNNLYVPPSAAGVCDGNDHLVYHSREWWDSDGKF